MSGMIWVQMFTEAISKQQKMLLAGKELKQNKFVSVPIYGFPSRKFNSKSKFSHLSQQTMSVFSSADFACLFGLILYVPSTIFQLCRDGSSWVEPELS